MKQFNVYMNPLKTYEAVKQGWSWPGFFFTVIWAFVKKMWLLGFGVLAICLVLVIIEASVGGERGQAIGTLGVIVLAFIFGAKGNKWRQTKLTLSGFEFKETVTAANAEGAISIYMKANSENQNEATAVPV